MDVETGMTLEPGGDFGVLVGRVVVANDVKLKLGSDLLRSCAGRSATLDDDGAGRYERIPCRKDRRRQQKGLPSHVGRKSWVGANVFLAQRQAGRSRA